MEIEQALEIVNAAIANCYGRHLSDVETAIFRGAWDNQTYEQIADEFGYSISYIQRDAGVKLWKLLTQALGEPVSKTNFRSALERQQRGRSPEEGLDLQFSGQTQAPISLVASSPLSAQCDWGEAIDVRLFYGRTEELHTLRQWIEQDRCRLVALLGMGGIGKTALSVKLAYELTGSFQRIIWRSLRHAPPLETLLRDLVAFLSDQQETEATLSRLLYWLQQARCLVILDNLETILQADRIGQYRPGYENYGELIRTVGDTFHSSCMILTSREKPNELATLEGSHLLARSLQLMGSSETAMALIHASRLTGTETQKQQLGQLYDYNPLALKIVANSIRELFGGEIAEFLAEDIAIFNEVRRLLDQQFARLSPLEQTIMFWLAINREWTTIAELAEDIFPAVSRVDLLEALKSLRWRSLIEKKTPLIEGKKTSCYTQQAVVMEYVTDRLVTGVCEELTGTKLQPDTQFLADEKIAFQSCFLYSYALLKTTVKDSIRQAQMQLLVAPIVTNLRTQLRTDDAIKQRFQQLLQQLRFESSGYMAGNLINLCQPLHLDLTGYDFSYLSVWHTDLQTVNLHRVNFAYADLSKSNFAQTFGYVLSVAISPGGDRLATGDGNGQVRLWRMADGQPLLVLQDGYTSWVWSVAFSPDGKVLASGSVDQTIQLWDVETGECLRTLEGHENWVRSVAFSPDGKVLASGSTDRTVRLWDIATGECLKVRSVGAAVGSVDWHPSGRWLATGNQNHQVTLWDVETESCLQFAGHEGGVRSVAFSPDGKVLASAGDDRTIRLWHLQTSTCVAVWQGHHNAVWSLAFSPDGRQLASVSHDQTIRIWDVATGQSLKQLSDHTDWVWDVAWSLDGRRLATVAHDRQIKLWDAQTGSSLRTIRGYTSVAMGVAWSPDSNWLAASCDDQVVRIWDRQTGQCLHALKGHTRGVWGVAWSPDGKILASSGDDHTVRLWDLQRERCLKVFQHTNWVWSIAFSPNGQQIATATQNYEVYLWEVQTGQCIQTLRGHEDSIWSVVWSPDGQTIATGCDDQTLRLWNAATGACLKVLQHDQSVRRIAFSPDGQWLASSSADSIVRLWEVSTGEWVRSLQGHRNSVWSVAFSPDGQVLASGGDDQTIRLWQTTTGDSIESLQGHTHQIWSIAFSPNGQWLASSSADQTIRVWQVQTGECIRILRATLPYEGMNVLEIRGLTDTQKMTLKALGAIERQ